MDYQLNRRKKNIFVFINQGIGIDLALKVFIVEKSGSRGGCFKRLVCIFFNIEMTEIVFL